LKKQKFALEEKIAEKEARLAVMNEILSPLHLQAAAMGHLHGTAMVGLFVSVFSFFTGNWNEERKHSTRYSDRGSSWQPTTLLTIKSDHSSSEMLANVLRLREIVSPLLICWRPQERSQQLEQQRKEMDALLKQRSALSKGSSWVLSFLIVPPFFSFLITIRAARSLTASTLCSSREGSTLSAAEPRHAPIADRTPDAIRSSVFSEE
jgi:hypothetical protein